MGGQEAPKNMAPDPDENALQETAEKIARGVDVKVEEVQTAYERTLKADEAKYKNLKNNSSYYGEHAAEFKKDLGEFRDRLIQQVQELQSANEAKKGMLLRETPKDLNELKAVLKDRSERLAAEKYGLEAADPTKLQFEGGEFGAARLKLAGYLSAYRLAGEDRAREELKRGGIPSRKSAKNFTLATVDEILGTADYAKIDQLNVNNLSKGYLIGLLKSSKQVLSAGDVVLYEQYFSKKLADGNFVGRIPKMDTITVKEGDQSEKQEILPLITVDEIMTPQKFAEKIPALKEKHDQLKHLYDGAIVPIEKALPPGDRLHHRYSDVLNKGYADSDEKELDAWLTQARDDLHYYINGSGDKNSPDGLPGLVDQKIAKYHEEIDAKKDMLGEKKSQDLHDLLGHAQERKDGIFAEDAEDFDKLKSAWQTYEGILSQLRQVEEEIAAAERQKAGKEKKKGGTEPQPQNGEPPAPGEPSAPEYDETKTDEEVVTENWPRRQLLTETDLKTYGQYKGDFVTNKTLESRDYDGKIGEVPADTQITIRPEAGRKVLGKHGAVVYLLAAYDEDDFVNHPEKTFYVRFSEYQMAPEPSAPRKQPEGPKKPLEYNRDQARALEEKYPVLGKVNLKYLEVLKALDTYTGEADGIAFEFPFGDKLLPCRVVKEDNHYVLHFQDELTKKDVAMVFDFGENSFNQLLLEINDGGLAQNLAWRIANNKKSYKPYEDLIGGVDSLDKAATQQEFIELELDWNYPDPDISLLVNPDGTIDYTVKRENVGAYGEEVRIGTANSFTDLMVALGHIKKWAEMPPHEKGEDKATRAELLFAAASEPSAFEKEEARIGRLVSFHIEPNELIQMNLDWGNGNVAVPEGNPLVTLKINQDGTLTYALRFDAKKIEVGPLVIGSLHELIDVLQREKVKADAIPLPKSQQSVKPYYGLKREGGEVKPDPEPQSPPKQQPQPPSNPGPKPEPKPEPAPQPDPPKPQPKDPVIFTGEGTA